MKIRGKKRHDFGHQQRLNGIWLILASNFQSTVRQFAIFLLFLATLLAPPTAPTYAGPFRPLFERCKNLFKKPKAEKQVNFRYAYDDVNRPISFGFEVELNIRENPHVVNDYRPAHITEIKWLAFTYEERVQVARAWDKENEKSEKGTHAYYKLASAPTWLPSQLNFEGDGNFEINGFVTNDYANLKDRIRMLVERYGPGSFQTHVVTKNGANEGAAGYSIFSGDVAQFETLDRGYKQHLNNPEFIPGNNLSHHSLGPLAEKDRQKLLEIENAIQKNSHHGAIGSTRTTYSSILRDDKYPSGYFGWEIRQFHKRYNELLVETDFLAKLLETDHLSRFAIFAQMELIHENLPAIRSQELEVGIDVRRWTDFFKRIGVVIKDPYPQLRYGGASVSERFYFPLRDWQHNPAVLALDSAARDDIKSKIQSATKNYFHAIQKLVEKDDANPAIVKEIQILVAKWAYESGMFTILQDFKKKVFLESESSRGPPQTELSDIEKVKQILNNQNDISGEDFLNHPNYRLITENTIEIIFQDAGEFGHAWLRAGNYYYDLKYKMKVAMDEISESRYRSYANWGGLIPVSKEKIVSIQQDLNQFYTSIREDNVPPFDAYSPLVQIQGKDKNLRFITPTAPQYGALPIVKGTLIARDGKWILSSDHGLEIPVIEQDHDKFVQSLSCSTVISHVLDKYLGVQIPTTGAQGLRTMIRKRSGPIVSTIKYQNYND